MATTTMTTTTIVPGTAAMSEQQMIEQFRRIIQLKDDIMAGKYPMISVPAHFVVEKAAPSVSSQSTVTKPPHPSSQAGLGTAREQNESPATSTPPITTASGIDPVLLTKSNDLIRAELGFQRQRLEKQLKEQADQKKLDFRKRPSPAEGKPDFDVKELLANAIEHTRMLEGKAQREGEEISSFDTNSLYSSRAPDSTPEKPDVSSDEEQPVETTDRTADASMTRIPTVSPQPFKAAASMNPISTDAEDEEGEYEPPEVTEVLEPLQPRRNGAPYNAESRHIRRYSDLDRGPRDNMRIDQDTHHNRGNSRSPSPDGHGRGNKRRKLDRNQRKGRRGVKDENVSPPPFHDIQPLGKPPDSPSADVEDSPPSQVRYVQRYEEPQARPVSRTEYLIPEPRVVSRASGRSGGEQDLRRIASMRNMRAEQPQYVEMPRQRATSYVRLESPAPQARYVPREEEEPFQDIRLAGTPVPEPRLIYRQPEPEIRYVREHVPPPPRERIIVDQHGNRFREIIDHSEPATPQFQQAGIPSPIRANEIYAEPRSSSRVVETQPRYVQQDMAPPQLRQVEQPRTAYREVYTPARAGSVQVIQAPRPRQVIHADDDSRAQIRAASVRPQTRYEEVPRMQVLSRPTSVRPREASVYTDDRVPPTLQYIQAEQPRYRVLEPEQPQFRYVDQYGREVPGPMQRADSVRHVERY